MNNIKAHISFKIVTIILVASLLVPTGVKFAHILTHHNHEHEVCKGEKNTHLHKVDKDCVFYKFKLSTNYFWVFSNTELIIDLFVLKTSNSSYTFLNNHHELSYSLRGPPVLV